MSPDLERLLNALYELREGEAKHRAHWKATVERLIADALTKMPPGHSRENVLDAIELRYKEFRRARRQPPTLPPQA